jgi:hypothetical protein
MSEKPAGPAKKKIAIEIPKELNAQYANLAFITHTASEIVLDFVQLLPHTSKGKVISRVVMSPARAKMVNMALSQNIANYERQFGEINIRTQPNLADELFRFPPDSDEENEE